MSLALLFHFLMLNMFRMLIYPSSEAGDLFVELFHGLYCSGLMCVGVTLWFGWGGVVSVCRLQPTYGSLFFLLGIKPRLIRNAGESVHQLDYAASQINTICLEEPFDTEFEYEI